MKTTILFLTAFIIILAIAYSKPSTVIIPDKPDATVIHEEVVETTSGTETHSFCPADMVEINGSFCPNLIQQCLRWVDAHGTTVPAPNDGSGRCAEWKRPVRCPGPTVHKHYCIDRYEFPNKVGEIPQDWMSWYDAKKAAEDIGKRLCTHSEWSFAAEGPDWHPYPYGDGYHRDKTKCNFDNDYNGIDVFKATSPDSQAGQALHAMLRPSGSMPECVSDFGVYDMVGNIDEWVVNESGHPYVSGLCSGHIFGIRNASRPMTTAHNPEFKWYETGARMCRDIQ